MDEQQTTPTGPVVPEWLRTFLYVSGTLTAGLAAALVGDVPDVWVSLGAGYGSAALLVASGYRPTR